MKPRLLLHVCCAVCETAAVERLREDYRTTAYFFGPNIHPEEEYRLRASEARRYAGLAGIDFLEGDYDAAAWDAAVAGLESEPEGGARCAACYRIRLRETARRAREEGFDAFCCTLTVSPHKRAELINAIGAEEGAALGVGFVPADFKKRDGFKLASRLAREAGLYRQRYCGCRHSKPPDD